MSALGGQLTHRLDKDAATVLNLDAQAVTVQHPDTYRGVLSDSSASICLGRPS